MYMSMEQEIKDKALALGFDAVGITDASPVGAEHIAHFEAWLSSGCAGRMEYLHRNLEKRVHPAALLSGARSVIAVALAYKPPAPAPAVRWASPTIPTVPGETYGKVAQYAQYEDYHPFIRALLGELAMFIRAKMDGAQEFKICVDAAPLAEKALAVRAGLGFIGKNHLLIHPRLGPEILLGEIVTTVGLHPDTPTGGSCAGCDRCVQACPTGALRPDGLLDARRCISYLTQYGSPEEGNEGMVEYRSNGGNATQPTDSARSWLFGCDECLLACPFQQSAPARANQRFQWYAERARLIVQEVLELSTEEFEARFHDSPVRRIGLAKLQRNARDYLQSK